MKMKRYVTKGRAEKIVVFVGILSLALTPSQAYAAGADASILLPKPAEFISALVAFLVIWALLARFAWPVILESFDRRKKVIQSDLDQAASARVKAEEELRVYEHKLADAQREADAIIAEARQAAEKSRAAILAKAQDDALRLSERAREMTENERRIAADQLRDSVADLSVKMALRIIHERLDEAKQHELIDRYLDEVGNLNEQ